VKPIPTGRRLQAQEVVVEKKGKFNLHRFKAGGAKLGRSQSWEGSIHRKESRVTARSWEGEGGRNLTSPNLFEGKGS